MNLKKLMLIPLLISGFSCRDLLQQADSKGIIGPDDRQAVDVQDQLNLSVFGLVSHIGSCTAFAIGPQTLVTVAHCLTTETAAKQKSDIKITNGRGENFTLSKILDIERDRDLAKLEIVESLPYFFETKSPETTASTKLVAFDHHKEKSGDGHLIYQSNCKIGGESEKDSGIFFHDCDTESGYSGAPLIQDSKVVGIHLGYAPVLKKNLFLAEPSVKLPPTPKLSFAWLPEAISCRTKCFDKCKAQILVGTFDLCMSDCEIDRVSSCARDRYNDVINSFRTKFEYESDRLTQRIAEGSSRFGDRVVNARLRIECLERRIADFGSIGASQNCQECLARSATSGPGLKVCAPECSDSAENYLQALHDCANVTSLNSPDTLKHGNNGTVNCSTFCESARWSGKVGSCLNGQRADTGEKIGCFKVPGFLGGPELTCACDESTTFIKPGNNGTVSCRQFCNNSGGRNFGKPGICLSARREDRSEVVGCDDVTGNLGGPALLCWCN